MTARVMFLGRLEDAAGCPFEDLAMPGALPWQALLQDLRERHSPELAEAVEAPKVRAALNGALLADKRALVLADGDELAFLPPVSGG